MNFGKTSPVLFWSVTGKTERNKNHFVVLTCEGLVRSDFKKD